MKAELSAYVWISVAVKYCRIVIKIVKSAPWYADNNREILEILYVRKRIMVQIKKRLCVYTNIQPLLFYEINESILYFTACNCVDVL